VGRLSFWTWKAVSSRSFRPSRLRRASQRGVERFLALLEGVEKPQVSREGKKHNQIVLGAPERGNSSYRRRSEARSRFGIAELRGWSSPKPARSRGRSEQVHRGSQKKRQRIESILCSTHLSFGRLSLLRSCLCLPESRLPHLGPQKRSRSLLRGPALHAWPLPVSPLLAAACSLS